MDFKQEAAKKAVTFIQNGFSVGLGAGATIAYMVDCLQETKPDIQLYTSSAATKTLLQQNGFQVHDIAAASQLDIYFDGCDQFDKDLNALKSGGGIHTVEKLLASMAKEFVLVGDESKQAEQLGTKYPLVLEVLPQAFSFVPVEIKKRFKNAKAVTRLDNKTSQPVLTGNSNYLVDIWFAELPELSNLNTLLKSITGVVETSLFFNMATKAVVAGEGGIKVIEKRDRRILFQFGNLIYLVTVLSLQLLTTSFMKLISRYLLFYLVTLLFINHVSSQSVAVKQVKLTKFTLQSSAVVTASGQALSTADYQPKDYWFPVTVPCTVLTGLVANKVYPDPYIGLNNMLIPDASDSFNHQYHLEQYSYLPNDPNPWKKPYWYRTQFSVPAEDNGRHFQLIFKGINYRADVWVNGTLIADSSQMAGMFAEYSLDVSKAVKAGAENILAVKIYPLDYPGLPSHPQLDALGDFYANGGPTGDIGKNVTMLSSVGWDWIPAVRDRNMGIWLPVYLRTSGQVVITRPFIKTELPSLPDTGLAKLSINLSLSNNSNQTQQGKLLVTISPENFSGNTISFTKDASLKASETKDLQLSSNEVKALLINKPHLWWPNNYGEANLYRLRLQYVAGNEVSDDTSFIFGIRTVSSNAVDVNGWTRRDFYVNGKRVHLDGGAWVPDMMLNRDSLRYDDELHLCRNANVNLVRIWGGGIGETDDFYEAADRYGMLVWQDFWVTGDTHGEFKGSANYPLQANVFINNILSTIYRIRNHASLLVWTGGNEGHARKELYDAMRDNVSTLDGTRPFIPSSSGFAKQAPGWKGSWPDDKPAGVYSGGPYSWQDDAQYYKLINGGKDWVFKDETGLPSQPPYNTLAKIVNNLVPDSSLPFPLNNTWGYHDACSGNGHYETYYKAMAQRYGEPVSMKDFSEKMQLLNAGGYRGIFEAAGHKLNETGGVMLWKLNAAFPSVIWQIYDWYLEPNAGYYFMQRACEPVHIQLNLDDSAVAVINRTYHAKTGLSFAAELTDMNGTSLYKQTGTINADTTSEKEILPLKDVLQKATGISFLHLGLKDKNGKPVSDNVYWFSPNHDFTSLRQMQPASLQVKIVKSEQIAGQYQWTIEFYNDSKQLAFFINPQLKIGDEEVLPSFWSDNYFSIGSGERKTVTVTCKTSSLHGAIPELTTEGWNIKEQTMSLPISSKEGR